VKFLPLNIKAAWLGLTGTRPEPGLVFRTGTKVGNWFTIVKNHPTLVYTSVVVYMRQVCSKVDSKCNEIINMS
jgi:hypothetical protein